jgi:hypothetical protein
MQLHCRRQRLVKCTAQHKLWQVRPTLGKWIQRCQKTCNNCQLKRKI